MRLRDGLKRSVLRAAESKFGEIRCVVTMASLGILMALYIIADAKGGAVR